jgi:hypothetical protein
MGLAEDLKALQDLRDKGEMSESDYAAARDTVIGKQIPPVGNFKTSNFSIGSVILRAG